MPRVVTKEQRERFYQLARDELRREEYAYHQTGKLFSGTDCAEAPFHGYMRQIWITLSQGLHPKLAIEQQDKEWRKYAEQNNAKVEAAVKIKRGPSAGQSVISYRWVCPEKVQSSIPHVYTMWRIIMGVT